MKDEKKGPLNIKSYLFAIEIVRLSQRIIAVHKEYVLTKQILRSGTAIGAIFREAEYASSRTEFIYKLTLSLKEANETVYWLHLLFDTDYISKSQFDKLKPECEVLISMLIASIRTSKGGMRN
jgi:four helix bundle protein